MDLDLVSVCKCIFLQTINMVLVIACFAVIATGMAQIFTNTYQKSLDCNALQLLYHTAPYIALVSPSVISLVNSTWLPLEVCREC